MIKPPLNKGVILNAQMHVTNYEQERTLSILVSTGGLLSLVASVWMIIVLLLKKGYRVFSMRILIYLGVYDLLAAISEILVSIATFKDNEVLCVFSAFFASFSHVSVFCVVFIISFNLYWLVKNGTDASFAERYLTYFLILLPICTAALPLITKSYGRQQDGRCFMKDVETTDKWFYFIALLAPFILSFVVVIILNIASIIKVRFISKARDAMGSRTTLKPLVCKLVWYPIAFLILWCPVLVYYAFLLTPRNVPFAVLLLESAPHTLFGVVNAFVFAYSHGKCACTLNMHNRLLSWSYPTGSTHNSVAFRTTDTRRPDYSTFEEDIESLMN